MGSGTQSPCQSIATFNDLIYMDFFAEQRPVRAPVSGIEQKNSMAEQTVCAARIGATGQQACAVIIVKSRKPPNSQR
jgi:hypothetical protein